MIRVAYVSALYIYPIKACRGIRVSEWRVAARGFDADRRWMIADLAGNFVTQRELPALSQVETSLLGGSLRVAAPGQPTLEIPRAYESGASRSVQVWQDQVSSTVHAEGSAWFSRFLGAPHELVYMPDAALRQVN
ncbi:MAG: MOSC domain-containing protein, partial [Pseudomonadota bacterium]